MYRIALPLFFILLTLSEGDSSQAASGQAQFAAAHLLPESVILYAETASSDELLRKTWDHPLRRKIEAATQYSKWLDSNEYKRLLFGITFLELQLDIPWRRAVEKMAAGGVTFAVDGSSQSVAMLMRADDAAFLKRTSNKLLSIARSGATSKRQPDPFQAIDYRGVATYRVDQAHIAIAGPWLILASSDSLSKNILDRLLDGTAGSLAENEKFQLAAKTRNRSVLAWAYADLETLRAVGVAQPLLGGEAIDPGAELIFGGVLGTLHETPFATAQLSATADNVELALTVPHDPKWIAKEREFFFGDKANRNAPPEIGLPGTVAELRARRDISSMWLHGPELFNEEINAGLAKANSDLSTLFGGRPFAEEILGALDGGLRFVVVREPNQARRAASGVLHLPGFAAAGRLKDPKDSQRTLRIAFQTAIGFLNLNAAQEGQPPLELETERRKGRVLLTASYAPEDLANDNAARRGANTSTLLELTPTIAFANDLIVLASTRTLANQALDRLAKLRVRPPRNKAPIVNSAVRVRAQPLRSVLAENRERLISKNMLEKGHSRSAAEREIDGLLTLLGFFDQANAALLMSDDQLRFALRISPAKE